MRNQAYRPGGPSPLANLLVGFIVVIVLIALLVGAQGIGEAVGHGLKEMLP